MNHGYIYLVFLLILAFLILQPNSNAGKIISTLGGQATNQIIALQGRGSGTVG